MLSPKAIKSFEPREETIFTKVDDFVFHNDFVYAINKQFRFLERLIKWIPVLYNDEDWDFWYLLKIIDFKLGRLRKVIAEDDIHYDAPWTVKKIDVIRGRMDRFLNSEKYIGDMPSRGEVDDWFERTEEGHLRMKESTPEQKEYIKGMIKFEEKNYKGFFKSLEKYLTQIWS